MDERIKPGMQKAVICALLTTRDIIEYRKVGEPGAKYGQARGYLKHTLYDLHVHVSTSVSELP